MWKLQEGLKFVQGGVETSKIWKWQIIAKKSTGSWENSAKNKIVKNEDMFRSGTGK